MLDTIREERERAQEHLKAASRTVLRTLRREGGVSSTQVQDVTLGRFGYGWPMHAVVECLVVSCLVFRFIARWDRGQGWLAPAKPCFDLLTYLPSPPPLAIAPLLFSDDSFGTGTFGGTAGKAKGTGTADLGGTGLSKSSARGGGGTAGPASGSATAALLARCVAFCACH